MAQERGEGEQVSQEVQECRDAAARATIWHVEGCGHLEPNRYSEGDPQQGVMWKLDARYYCWRCIEANGGRVYA